MRFSAGIRGKLGFEQAAYLVGIEAAGTKVVDGFTHDALRGSHLPGSRASPASHRRARSDKCAYSVPKIKNSLQLQFAIDTRDRVRIDHQGLSEVPDTGETIAGAERACFAGVPDLLLELEIDRDAEGWVRLEKKCHCISLLVDTYSTAALAGAQGFRRVRSGSEATGSLMKETSTPPRVPLEGPMLLPSRLPVQSNMFENSSRTCSRVSGTDFYLREMAGRMYLGMNSRCDVNDAACA